MVRRFLVLACALVFGAAAPARAWCEATCLAPIPASDAAAKPHCPTHDPAPTGTSMSATQIDDCPAVESATASSKIASPRVSGDEVSAPLHPCTAAPVHRCTSAPLHPDRTVFERSTPLRI